MTRFTEMLVIRGEVFKAICGPKNSHPQNDGSLVALVRVRGSEVVWASKEFSGSRKNST